MSVCYHPHAFDAESFAAALEEAVDPTPEEVETLLAERLTKEPHFGWSIDGTEDGDIIGCRVPDDGDSVSLVEHVRLGLSGSTLPPYVEVHTLLGHVSEYAGRLIEDPSLESSTSVLGYLLPHEIARAAALLRDASLEDAAQERDRLLLLQVFDPALDAGRGLFWDAS